jgi:uncharacterized membrane protein YhfC
MFGAGHGGVESIIFGGLGILGVLNVVLAPLAGAAANTPEVKAQIAAFWAGPGSDWMNAVWGGVERVGALSFHIGASLFVMRAVVRRNPVYLLLAIFFHALTDGGAIALKMSGVGAAPLEGAAVGSGIIVLVLALLQRDDAVTAPKTT